VVPKVGGEKL